MQLQLSNQFTKEAIKARMMQHAANLWGVKNPQALDPFVRLLVEAFSIEIYRAANESQNVEGRILDKLANLLTPNQLTMPQPGHGIMQAMPSSMVHALNPMTQLFTTKRIASKAGGLPDENLHLHFTPVGAIRLTRARVACIAAGHQLFAMDTNNSRIPVLRTADAMPWATCYIGVETDGSIAGLEGSALCFEFSSFNTQPWIYQLLPLAEITLNDQKIQTTPGLEYLEDAAGIGAEAALFDSHDVMRQALESVKQVYGHKFLTLHDLPVFEPGAGPVLPEALLLSFKADDLKNKLPDRLIWLQLKFPANYAYNVLEELTVSLNAFPVVNRLLKVNNYSYKSLNNILPLRTGAHEHFLSVHQVSDGHNRAFTEIPFNRSSQHQSGYYSLRQGGAERFDERSAQDMVNYLLELTRDEVAAFSSLNQNFLIATLQDLSRQLQLLHNRAGKIEANIRQVPTYLIAEPYEGDENLEVAYWLTHSGQANSLRAGTAFHEHNSTELEPGSIMLLSDIQGGREKLQPGERLDAYRYALQSRGRLITNEDIRAFCHYELSGKLKNIFFKKGLSASPVPKQGYIRTLDIILVPHHYEEFDDTTWTYMGLALQAKIIANSPDTIPYRVRVEKAVSG